jgi:ubiquinone/menaquinone biosynthesis C-methylase UbiE
MSYTFYSFRNRTEQDESMWADQTFEGLIDASQNRKLHRIFDKYLTKPNMKILEAGCGMGTWIHNLRAKGHEVIGVDYMESTVQKVKEFDPSLPIQQGDVNNLNFPDESFDAYVSLGVVEHFQEGPQKALSEAYRVLKPNGVAFVTVPYLNVLRRLITHPMRNTYFGLRRLQGKKDYFWEYRYTQKELSGFLEQAGFKIIDVDIDDYIEEDTKHHIGLCADFFFLRSKTGEIWELNGPGKLLLKMGKAFSPWVFCSGLHLVARKN